MRCSGKLNSPTLPFERPSVCSSSRTARRFAANCTWKIRLIFCFPLQITAFVPNDGCLNFSTKQGFVFPSIQHCNLFSVLFSAGRGVACWLWPDTLHQGEKIAILFCCASISARNVAFFCARSALTIFILCCSPASQSICVFFFNFYQSI